MLTRAEFEQLQTAIWREGFTHASAHGPMIHKNRVINLLHLWTEPTLPGKEEPKDEEHD